MKKRSSFLARTLAALALIAVILAVFLIVSAGIKDDSTSESHRSETTTTKQEKPTRPRTKAATYTVKPGDTLIAIAHKTGVRVSELQALNPEVDPQILIAGETLKLR